MKKAAKKHVVPCPKCGSAYPIVIAIWDKGKLICVCTKCGIEGTVEKS